MIGPRSIIYYSIRVLNSAEPTSLIVHPAALVCGAIFEYFDPISTPAMCIPLTFVHGLICICESAEALIKSINHLTMILVPSAVHD